MANETDVIWAGAIVSMAAVRVLVASGALSKCSLVAEVDGLCAGLDDIDELKQALSDARESARNMPAPTPQS